MPQREATPPVSRATPHGDRPGDDYNRRMTWAQLLEPVGWTIVFERGDTTYWRRPGKAVGVSATTNHAGSDLFYCFSSSTEFQPETSYSKFGVYATFQHGGDFRKAALALAKRGYGPQDDSPIHTDVAQARTIHELRRRRRPRAGVSPSRVRAIIVRPVRWAWTDRVPVGTLGLIGGREGLGKSILSTTLAAQMTRGTLPGIYFGRPRTVIICAKEDSWEHTITPRLMAAGADLDRVGHVEVVTEDLVETSLSLPRDLVALEQLIRDEDAGLVILDPLLSRLEASLDTHKDGDVRRALEPLASLANRADAAVLGLIHVNKSTSGDPLTMLMASRAFAAVARSVVFVMADPDDETHRLMGQPKNNLGRLDLPTLGFRISGALVATTAEGEVWTGQLRWTGETTRTIGEALEVAAQTSGDRSATSEAQDWLDDYLTSQGGSAESSTVKAAGKDAGHALAAVNRARKLLKVKTSSAGFPCRTTWHLPARVQLSHRPGETYTTTTTETTTANRGFLDPPVVAVVSAVGDGIAVDTTAVDADLPACLRDLTVPDFSDPIGTHDEETPEAACLDRQQTPNRETQHRGEPPEHFTGPSALQADAPEQKG